MSTLEQPLVVPTHYNITCRLCRQQFRGKPMEASSDGRPTDKMNKVGKVIWDHMMKQHSDFAVMALLVAGFVMEDPVAIQFSAIARYMVFQSTRRHYVPDEKLKDTLSRLQGPEEIEAAFVELRDFLTETGKFGPQLPPEATRT